MRVNWKSEGQRKEAIRAHDIVSATKAGPERKKALHTLYQIYNDIYGRDPITLRQLYTDLDLGPTTTKSNEMKEEYDEDLTPEQLMRKYPNLSREEAKKISDGWWQDPAGGWHSPNETDYASQYESTKELIESNKSSEEIISGLSENKNDYVGRFGSTNISIKNGHKNADENTLYTVYEDLGKLMLKHNLSAKEIIVKL